MTKTIDDHFRDWESDTFGYGYGTGEEYIIPALREFMVTCPDGGCYDHSVLEADLGRAVAWLLINTLCHCGIIEYSTSPRYGWLSKEGKALKDYMLSKTVSELYEICCGDGEGAWSCGPPESYGPNPFGEGKRV